MQACSHGRVLRVLRNLSGSSLHENVEHGTKDHLGLSALGSQTSRYSI